MSGLENLRTRLNYLGGARQQSRMNEDKLTTLKRALLYSYQAATMELADGRQFRCLINPDKIKNDYDNKIVSVPFKDICLNEPMIGKTSEGIQSIGLKAGDVFEWKDNGTYWITYLQRLEETAYFRAEIRRCRYEIEVNGNKYKVYTRGPVEETIDYYKLGGGIFNNMNYTLLITITKNKETDEFFHRFTKVKFMGKDYEVQAIDGTSTEGVLDIYLKEDFSNPILDEINEEKKNIPEVEPLPENAPQIEGDLEVYPYDIKEFTIKNATDGKWFINNNKVKILAQSDLKIKVQIITGKSGKFILSYKNDNDDEIAMKEIKILSL